MISITQYNKSASISSKFYMNASIFSLLLLTSTAQSHLSVISVQFRVTIVGDDDKDVNIC